MVRAYLGLGGNLGDVRRTISEALDALHALPQTRLSSASRLYRTPPWGVPDQPPFLNAAAELETVLPAQALLQAMLDIERAAGRVREGERWGPRTLDLDLLLYGDRSIDAEGLTVPHPRIAERAFVLVPLHELDPTLVIPGSGAVVDLLEAVDSRGCQPLDERA